MIGSFQWRRWSLNRANAILFYDDLLSYFLESKAQLQNINLTHYFQSLWSKIGWLCTLRSRPFVLWRMVSSIGAVGSVKSIIETSVTFSDISKLLILKQTHTPVLIVLQNSRLGDRCKDMKMQCINKKQNPHNLWMLKRIVPVREFVEDYTSGMSIYFKALNHKQDLSSFLWASMEILIIVTSFHLNQAWSLKIHKRRWKINGISVNLFFSLSGARQSVGLY